MAHRNARLTFHGRRLLVGRVVVEGQAVAHVAKAMGVSRQCGHRWVTRFKIGGLEALHDRSSRPHSMPTRTSAEIEAAVVAARREHRRRGPDWLGPELGVPARTVSRILRRHDLPRLGELDPPTATIIRASKTTAVRDERERPGELVHMDVKKIGRIPNRGGWRTHGRSKAGAATITSLGARTRSSSRTAPGRTATSRDSTAPCKSNGRTATCSPPTLNDPQP